MTWMTVKQYQQQCYAEGSAPDRRTIIARIRSGALVGKKEGQRWYVDPHAIPQQSPTARAQAVLAAFSARGD